MSRSSFVSHSLSFGKDRDTPRSQEGKGILRKDTQGRQRLRRHDIIPLPVLGLAAQVFGPGPKDEGIGKAEIADGDLEKRGLLARGLHQSNPQARPHYRKENAGDPRAGSEINKRTRRGHEAKDLEGTDDQGTRHIFRVLRPREAKPPVPSGDQRHIFLKQVCVGRRQRHAGLGRPGCQDPPE